jgi:hypothetical protein
MMIAGREIATRVVGMIVAAVLLIVAVSFGLYQCDKRRSEAAQSRVDAGQAGAASNSAADAIGTVARSGEREAASEDLTRANDRDIRAAPGAGDRVNAGVNAAGLQALCRREAYRNTERCKIFRRER